MYLLRWGVPQDYKTAVKWFRKAAEQGHAHAQNGQGVMLDEGLGVIQDTVYAHMWFNIAASNGSQFGVMTRNMVEKKMTAGDISKAQELARNCVAKQYKGC